MSFIVSNGAITIVFKVINSYATDNIFYQWEEEQLTKFIDTSSIRLVQLTPRCHFDALKQHMSSTPTRLSYVTILAL